MPDFPLAKCKEPTCGHEWRYRGKYAEEPDRVSCPRCKTKTPLIIDDEEEDLAEAADFGLPQVTVKEGSGEIKLADVKDIAIGLPTPEHYEPDERVKKIVAESTEPKTEQTTEKPDSRGMGTWVSSFMVIICNRLNTTFDTDDFTMDDTTSGILGDALDAELADTGMDVSEPFIRRLLILAILAMVIAIPLLMRAMSWFSMRQEEQAKKPDAPEPIEAEDVKITPEEIKALQDEDEAVPFDADDGDTKVVGVIGIDELLNGKKRG